MSNTVYFSGACISELGTINGAVGDQTGSEIRTTKAYTHSLGWRIFRYPDTKVAYWIGTNAYNIAESSLFGYGQNDRATGYNACKAAGWEPKKVKIKVNLDCSKMAGTCIACALEKDVPDFSTATEPAVLLSLGFKEITGTALSDLKLGDIVVTPSKGHTEIVSKVVKDATAVSSSTTSTASTTGCPYKVSILCSELNVRKGPGTSYAIVTKVKKGDVYTITATQSGWGKLKSGAGWISLNSAYVKKC